MTVISQIRMGGCVNFIRKLIPEASAESRHSTRALVRMPAASSLANANNCFKSIVVDNLSCVIPDYYGDNPLCSLRAFWHEIEPLPHKKSCLYCGNHSDTKKSKVLVIGGTGYLGKFIVEASAKSGRPTFVLVRKSTLSNPAKAKIVEDFKSLGVILLQGDIHNPGTLLNGIKLVDVVISVVGVQVEDQAKIVAAIQKARNIMRFLPSEFGNDVDRVHAVEPAKSGFAKKANIRRLVEAAGIPYTYVCANSFAGYYLPTLSQLRATAPPRDKVEILGDGNAKVVINKEDDIGTYTIKSVDDPTTLCKTLYIRPPENTYSMNDLVSLWESKIGKTLEKVYVSENQVLKYIQDDEPPGALMWALYHCNFVKGDQTNFEIQPSFGVEASELYPDVEYMTVDQQLDQFV